MPDGMLENLQANIESMRVKSSLVNRQLVKAAQELVGIEVYSETPLPGGKDAAPQ
jgi:hypothetical protein